MHTESTRKPAATSSFLISTECQSKMRNLTDISGADADRGRKTFSTFCKTSSRTKNTLKSMESAETRNLQKKKKKPILLNLITQRLIIKSKLCIIYIYYIPWLYTFKKLQFCYELSIFSVEFGYTI